MPTRFTRLIRHLPGYARIRALRDRRQFQAFTPDDERRCAFYASFIKPGDLVFDVGANMGNRSKVFLRLKARVIAFEPQQRCADFLASVLTGPDCTLVRQALGASPGEAEMLVSDTHTLSSISPAWVQAITRSGRFSNQQWQARQIVPVTTLDACIRQFGRPAFVKIDVEGYEGEVLAGLSSPVPALSFEFTPEVLATSFACLDRLTLLSEHTVFQYSPGETMTFALPNWTSAAALKAALAGLPPSSMGDVYARCPPPFCLAPGG